MYVTKAWQSSDDAEIEDTTSSIRIDASQVIDISIVWFVLTNETAALVSCRRGTILMETKF